MSDLILSTGKCDSWRHGTETPPSPSSPSPSAAANPPPATSSQSPLGLSRVDHLDPETKLAQRSGQHVIACTDFSLYLYQIYRVLVILCYGPRPQPTTPNLLLLSLIILIMSYQIPTSFGAQLRYDVPDQLDDSNWFTWSKKMKMALLAIGMAGITTGKKPDGLDVKEEKEWKASDGRLAGMLYGRISDEYQHLVEDLETGTAAWAALKAHFERSTIGYRMAARSEFYDITHDPSRPITSYIQSLQSAKQKLAALNVKIDDTEFKDVLLMHLDESFHSVRLHVDRARRPVAVDVRIMGRFCVQRGAVLINVLAQTTEPDLDKIKSMLASSTAADPVSVKIEAHGTYRITSSDVEMLGVLQIGREEMLQRVLERVGEAAATTEVKEKTKKQPRMRSGSMQTQRSRGSVEETASC
ncbi:hypothetical protein D9615_009925 [Tricholomella constricta]|uniref:Uncharacterized protein n=1 Tax=Tricholomella constricta TaxID=117010 RepID=A0A8H5GZU3_9AGAR|nr:hypothetical protein D9615_009925 [Tricholomella constricta]